MATGSAAPNNAVSDSEKTLMKEKLRLLEVDRKNFYESSQQQIRSNKDTIRRLRQENKDLKATIANAKRGAATVLDKEVRQLDDGIYHNTLGLDTARAKVVEKREMLAKMREELKVVGVECEPLLTEESYLTRKIRLLENRLDKSLIKYNEACAIRKTYDQIVKRLKEERVSFDNQLAAIERTLKAKDHDYEELKRMSHDANHAKEVAKKELHNFKTAFEEERKEKDRELTERKTYVQSKVEQTQKLERKEKALRQKDADEIRQAMDEDSPSTRRGTLTTNNNPGASAGGEEEQLAKYQEAFRAIQEATGVSEVNDVIQKFVSQEETQRNLKHMVSEAQARIDRLNVEKSELGAKLEELRYSGSGQLGSRRIVEEFELHLADTQRKTQQNVANYEKMAKLLISVKAGIEHLADKLSSYKAETQIPPMSDETVIEVLKICEAKINGLSEDVNPSDAAEDALITGAVELPTANRRVKLMNEEEGDEEEDGADIPDEQDDDAVLKRDQVKKISANSIQRETKKLRRKGNKQHGEKQIAIQI